MADGDSVGVERDDVAFRVFGTPERELRRRTLHPCQSEEEKEVEGEKDNDEVDSELKKDFLDLRSKMFDTYYDSGIQCQGVAASQPPFPPSPQPPSAPTPTLTDRIVAFVFHVAAAFFFIFMYFQREVALRKMKEEKGLAIPGHDTFGGEYKFLTFLNYNVLIMYFILALLVDVLPTGRPDMEKFRDFIFTTIVFPASLVMTTLFWGLTTFLPAISLGGEDSQMSMALKAIPPQINHSVHTAVGVAVVIEALLVYHHYFSNSDAFKSMFIWNFAYAVWVNGCYFYAGTLPYPMMVYLGPYLMNIMFIIFLTTCIASYFFGKIVTTWSWAGE